MINLLFEINYKKFVTFLSYEITTYLFFSKQIHTNHKNVKIFQEQVNPKYAFLKHIKNFERFITRTYNYCVKLHWSKNEQLQNDSTKRITNLLLSKVIITDENYKQNNHLKSLEFL